jgi:prevent-host-death family protein
MATWQVQSAKAHLSELIEDAQTKGPQIITKHGSETAVVLSFKEYRALAAPAVGSAQKVDLLDFLFTAPKFESDEDEAEFFASLRHSQDLTPDPNDLLSNDESEFERESAA